MIAESTAYDELAKAAALVESEREEWRRMGDEISRLERLRTLQLERVRVFQCEVIVAEARIRGGG